MFKKRNTMTQLRKTNDALILATLYINSGEVSEEELRSIESLLTCISGGNATIALSEKREELVRLRASNELYFKKHPHDYIVIVGDCKIKSQVLVGLFNSLGIERKNLKMFTDYDHLKKIFPFNDINSLSTKGVLIGSIPHSVSGLNGFASPKQAIESAAQKNKAFIFCAPELKISKEVIRTFARNISIDLQSKSP